MKKNIFIITAVVFLTAFIVGSGVFVLQKRTGEKARNEAVEKAKQEMQAQINELQNRLNHSIDLDLLVKQKMRWLREDGKIMCLDGRVILNTSFKNLSYIEEEKNAEYESLFEQAGFVKNEINTNMEGKQNILDPRIGFEKENMQCVISWSNHNTTFEIYNEDDWYEYKIICAKHENEDDENFDNFYSLINTDNSSDALICVDEKNDNFAVGSINFYRTGARWYASKQNGEWVLDLRTQEYPPCSIVKDYPKEFYRECRNY